MKQSEILRAKLDRHNEFYDRKMLQYVTMPNNCGRAIKRYKRLMEHSTLITKLIMAMASEMAVESFEN